MSGVFSNKKVIARILGRASKDDIRDLSQQYERDYGQTLIAALATALSNAPMLLNAIRAFIFQDPPGEEADAALGAVRGFKPQYGVYASSKLPVATAVVVGSSTRPAAAAATAVSAKAVAAPQPQAQPQASVVAAGVPVAQGAAMMMMPQQVGFPQGMPMQPQGFPQGFPQGMGMQMPMQGFPQGMPMQQQGFPQGMYMPQPGYPQGFPQGFPQGMPMQPQGFPQGMYMPQGFPQGMPMQQQQQQVQGFAQAFPAAMAVGAASVASGAASHMHGGFPPGIMTTHHLDAHGDFHLPALPADIMTTMVKDANDGFSAVTGALGDIARMI